MEGDSQTSRSTGDGAKRGSRWRHFRPAIAVFVAVAAVIALFYGEEDLRGWLAWRRFVAEQAALGRKIHLNIKELAPPLVPDDQNFCATPYWRYVFSLSQETGVRYTGPTNEYERARQIGEKFAFDRRIVGGWSRGHHAQLASSPEFPGANGFDSSPAAKTNRVLLAIEVLRAAEPFEPVRKEMLAAESRPYSRFEIDYARKEPWSFPLPAFSAIRDCGWILWARRAAETALGKTGGVF